MLSDIHLGAFFTSIYSGGRGYWKKQKQPHKKQKLCLHFLMKTLF